MGKRAALDLTSAQVEYLYGLMVEANLCSESASERKMAGAIGMALAELRNRPIRNASTPQRPPTTLAGTPGQMR